MYPISYLNVCEAYRRPPVVLRNQTTLGVELTPTAHSLKLFYFFDSVGATCEQSAEYRQVMRTYFHPDAQFIIYQIYTDLKTGQTGLTFVAVKLDHYNVFFLCRVKI